MFLLLTTWISSAFAMWKMQSELFTHTDPWTQWVSDPGPSGFCRGQLGPRTHSVILGMCLRDGGEREVEERPLGRTWIIPAFCVTAGL